VPEQDRPGARGAARPDLTPTSKEGNPVDRLPHTGPARLPERAVVSEPGMRVSAWRTLRPGDPCLNDGGLLPGVLLVELMAQVGGLLVDQSEGGPGGYGVLAGIKRMHLHGTAGAGETIAVECALVRRMGDLYMIECRARAGGEGGAAEGGGGVGRAEREIGHGTIQIRRVRGSAP
jgi:3-hydroxyacyl-[acyl-carrier-protein] dehydratase